MGEDAESGRAKKVTHIKFPEGGAEGELLINYCTKDAVHIRDDMF
jgi:hypothetical protein